jgi:hypothetical protein
VMKHASRPSKKKKSEPLNWDSRLEVQTGPVQKQDHLARAAACCSCPSLPFLSTPIPPICTSAIRAATPLARVCPSICPSPITGLCGLSPFLLEPEPGPATHQTSRPFPPLNLSQFVFFFLSSFIPSAFDSSPTSCINCQPSFVIPLPAFIFHSHRNCNTLRNPIFGGP